MTRFSPLLRPLLLLAGISYGLPVAWCQNTSPSNSSFAAVRQLINQDLANQRQMLSARRSDLVRWDASDQQAFQAAFGTTDPAARQFVLNCIDRELALSSQMTTGNFQPAPVSDPDEFAHVDASDPSAIYINNAYSRAPAVGQDSRAGTLVHEMSHFDATCRTQDTDEMGRRKYGVRNATNLANRYANGTSSFQPWRHADNLEYYVEGVFGGTSASPQSPQSSNEPSSQVDRTQLVMTDDVRQNIAQNAYNPPADIVGDGQSSRFVYDENAAPGQTGPVPQAPAGAAPQMTDEQFRAFMAVMMRQFQQAADAQQQAFDANRPVPADNSDADSPAPTFTDDSNAPRDEARLTFDESAPRNNNVGQPTQPAGNVGRRSQSVTSTTGRQNRVYSIDGSSRPIGASGYRTPVRQNRAYSIDGSSRPIGRSGNAAAAYWGVQQQAYRQIASQQSGGSYARNYSAGSTGTTVMSSGSNQPAQGSYYSYNEGAPAPSARLVFDDNAPRQSVATPTVVTPRQPATAQPTASAMPLSLAITPRQSGSAPRTAGIAPLH